MPKAPIKLEGYIGNSKVCNDLILGGNAHDRAFSDVYANMIYVAIDGLKDPNAETKQQEETFTELICPVKDLSLETEVMQKVELQKTRSF